MSSAAPLLFFLLRSLTTVTAKDGKAPMKPVAPDRRRAKG
jgi:hypothetical protein